jgi:nitroreductase
MSHQVYLALGILLSACAVNGIDACPMEGFQSTALDELLQLPAKGLNSVVLCPVGFRSSEDAYAQALKVRFPLEDLVTTLG